MDAIVNLAISLTDTSILLIYLSAVMVVGLLIGRGRRDPSEYLLGNRNLPWWAVLGSIVATETSTATFLSVPGIAFAADGDLRFLQLAMGFILGRLMIAVLLLPLYFRGRLFTAYEVLDERFGGSVKRAASLMFLVARNLGDGLRLFLAALVLEKVIGVDLLACIVLIGLATIVYTYAGGMKAVVWNDCIQFVVYMIGGVVALIVIVDKLPGGWSQFAEFSETHHKLRMIDMSTDLRQPYTLWAGLIGGTVLSLGTHGVDQMMVQRYLCTRSQTDATRALVLSGSVVFLQFSLFLILGAALACFYSIQPAAPVFDTKDEVLATFIVREMPTGLIGLTLAAVFSAAMSTLSSSLNSSASSATYDLYCDGKKSHDNSEGLYRFSRLMTLLFGLLQIVVAIVASYLSKSVVADALAIAGFTAGILLGVFFLGTLTECVKRQDALIGMLTGLAVLTLVRFLTPVAWPWYATIGLAVTFTTGLLGGMIRKRDS